LSLSALTSGLSGIEYNLLMNDVTRAGVLLSFDKTISATRSSLSASHCSKAAEGDKAGPLSEAEEADDEWVRPPSP
jgi:hypothetical protein